MPTSTQIRTSKSNQKAFSAAGMTLIEIMLVLGLLTFLTVAFATRFGSASNNVKSFLRHFKVLSRDLHSRAQLENTPYRIMLSFGASPKDFYTLLNTNKGSKDDDERKKLIYELQGEDSETLPHFYWVEKGTISSEGQLTFSPDNKIMKEAKTLPSIIKFHKIEPDTKQLLPNTDISYSALYYEPSGISTGQSLQIQFQNQDLIWTLSKHPFSGEILIAQEALSLNEALEIVEK